jgi:Lrp/AsnC family transcriptional regulator for asnA, asnC and gidA
MPSRQNQKPTPGSADGSNGSRLDETDKAIIRHLQEDGRMPYTKLGPLVGLSAPATRQRVLHLIERGVMQVVAVTDPVTLGFGMQVMLGVKSSGLLEAASDELSAIPEIDYVVVTTGRFDLLCEMVCEDNDHLLELLNQIRAMESVADVEVFTYVRLVKQTYDWGVR